MDEAILHNLIVCWFDENIQDWESIENSDWINHVCKETGLTEEHYKRIMNMI